MDHVDGMLSRVRPKLELSVPCGGRTSPDHSIKTPSEHKLLALIIRCLFEARFSMVLRRKRSIRIVRPPVQRKGGPRIDDSHGVAGNYRATAQQVLPEECWLSVLSNIRVTQEEALEKQQKVP